MKKAIIALLAVTGSSTAALADTSFSFRAQGSVGYGTPVRYIAPARHEVRTADWQYTNANRYYPGQVRVAVTPNYREYRDQRFEQPTVVPAPTEDCANWDPTASSQPGCDRIRAIEEPQLRGWEDLGVRDSAIGNHQYITEQRPMSKLRIDAVQGDPQITKVAVTFTDGAPAAIVNVSSWDCENRDGISINLPDHNVNQIVVYTAAGSRGTYAIYAR